MKNIQAMFVAMVVALFMAIGTASAEFHQFSHTQFQHKQFSNPTFSHPDFSASNKGPEVSAVGTAVSQPQHLDFSSGMTDFAPTNDFQHPEFSNMKMEFQNSEFSHLNFNTQQ